MDPSMQACLNTLKFGTELFLNGVGRLDDAAAHKQIAGKTNPPIWLAGHLTISRKYLLDLFGDERELSFELKFSEKYDPSVEYPPMAEIKDAWVSISEALLVKMAEASDDVFTRPIDWNLPNGDKTVRGALLFYAYHEGWHLGQLAYARVGMGMEGLVPY